ncbi:MAG: hypothetical protein AB8B84_13940 [Granulosicoccus sp.]
MKNIENGLQELTAEEMEVVGGGIWGLVAGLVNLGINVSNNVYEEQEPIETIFGALPPNLMLNIWGTINRGNPRYPGYPM